MLMPKGDKARITNLSWLVLNNDVRPRLITAYIE